MIDKGVIEMILEIVSLEEEKKAKDHKEYLNLTKSALILMNALLSYQLSDKVSH